MPTDSRVPALIDTSVLLNFLAVDRASLLAQHVRYRFVVTDHVHGEITSRRAELRSRYETAMEARHFDHLTVVDPAELLLFSSFVSGGRLDIGESAAAAVAVVRLVPLAIDDLRARKILLREHSTLTLFGTADLLRDLLGFGLLSLAEANHLKSDLETHHRFKMPFEKCE